MKNQIKGFGQFINESGYGMEAEAEVTIDFSLDESISNYAEMFAEMARIAPSCKLIDIQKDTQAVLLTFAGDESCCQAIADYSNRAHGGEDTEIERYSGRDFDEEEEY